MLFPLHTQSCFSVHIPFQYPCILLLITWHSFHSVLVGHDTFSRTLPWGPYCCVRSRGRHLPLATCPLPLAGLNMPLQRLVLSRGSSLSLECLPSLFLSANSKMNPPLKVTLVRIPAPMNATFHWECSTLNQCVVRPLFPVWLHSQQGYWPSGYHWDLVDREGNWSGGNIHPPGVSFFQLHRAKEREGHLACLFPLPTNLVRSVNLPKLVSS